MFSSPQIPTISNQEAQKQVLAGMQLIDVRTDAEYAEDHAKGAVHCPLDALLTRIKRVADTSAPMLVICKSGGRSAQAVKQLNDLGFETTNVEGGTDEWRTTGGPMLIHNTAPHVTALKAQTLMNQGVKAVDIRAAEQYRAAHAAGAVNIRFTGDTDEIMSRFNRDEPLLVLCNTGGSAASAAQALTDAGWKAYAVSGGTNAWKATGGKMESES